MILCLSGLAPHAPMPDSHDQSSDEQALYFNGFEVAFGSSDISIHLKRDNVDILALKASYTTTKTLAEALIYTIRKFEAVTAHKVMTIQDVSNAIRDNAKAEGLTLKEGGTP